MPALDAAALLAAVPGLTELNLKITARSFRGLPGASLSFDDLSQLIAVVHEELDSGIDGVVITQGTDTIEETAYFLDLTLDRAAPLVVTGAMRNPTLAGADGPVNLLAAVQSAASERIGLITACLGDDAELLRRLGSGFDGLVIAGFGVGHVPGAFVDPLAELALRIPVVLASRAVAGPVLRSTYGFPGSERDLQDRGLINSGFLGPFKARILLHVLVAAGADHHGIVTAFDAASGVAMPG